jgi:hypothetical protein
LRLALASNCATDRAVPKVIGAGVGHVMVGVGGVTVRVPLTNAKE